MGPLKSSSRHSTVAWALGIIIGIAACIVVGNWLCDGDRKSPSAPTYRPGIRGRILTEDGAPAAFWSVAAMPVGSITIHGVSEIMRLTANTSPDGEFAMETGPGYYDVIARRNASEAWVIIRDVAASDRPVTITATDAERRGVRISVRPVWRGSSVRDVDANCHLMYVGWHGSYRKSGALSRGAEWEWEPQVRGSEVYVLVEPKSGAASEWAPTIRGPVSLEGDQRGVEIELDGWSSIAVRCTDGRGVPLNGSLVTIGWIGRNQFPPELIGDVRRLAAWEGRTDVRGFCLGRAPYGQVSVNVEWRDAGGEWRVRSRVTEVARDELLEVEIDCDDNGASVVRRK